MADLEATVRCPGHKPLKIRPGERLLIGRHVSNHIVLASPSVSRHHAAIEWDLDEDRPRVHDNESANGVLVDGEPVDVVKHLRHGNRVQIGDHELAIEVTSPVDSKPAVISGDTSGRLELLDNNSPALSGTFLQRAELQRLLLDLEDTRCTGTLRVAKGDGRWVLVVCFGRVIKASGPGGAHGLAAVQGALQLDSGRYQFDPMVEPAEASLQISLRRLLRTSPDAGPPTIVDREG